MAGWYATSWLKHCADMTYRKSAMLTGKHKAHILSSIFWMHNYKLNTKKHQPGYKYTCIHLNKILFQVDSCKVYAWVWSKNQSIWCESDYTLHGSDMFLWLFCSVFKIALRSGHRLTKYNFPRCFRFTAVLATLVSSVSLQAVCVWQIARFMRYKEPWEMFLWKAVWGELK